MFASIELLKCVIHSESCCFALIELLKCVIHSERCCFASIELLKCVIHSERCCFASIIVKVWQLTNWEWQFWWSEWQSWNTFPGYYNEHLLMGWVGTFAHWTLEWCLNAILHHILLKSQNLTQHCDNIPIKQNNKNKTQWPQWVKSVRWGVTITLTFMKTS